MLPRMFQIIVILLANKENRYEIAWGLFGLSLS